MKTRSLLFVFLALPSLFFTSLAVYAQDVPPPPPDGAQGGPDEQGAPGDNQGDQSASFQTFYDQLGSQGNWVNTDNYGYVWQPNVQDANWAPYSNGHWVYTDDGWTWVADDSEPWGWATYHYGRWANIEDQGWVWIPGYTWAPAWVSWRYGGGYCGWAPLPPETSVGIDFYGGGVSVGVGFHIGGDCDRAYGIGAGYYNFVSVDFLGERNYRGHYVNRNNNYVIINNTRNVTNINVGREGAGQGNRFGRVTTGGPAFAAINAQSHVPIQRVRLTQSNQVGNASLRGNDLAVYAPRVQAKGDGNFRPRNVTGTINHVTINRGSDISRPLAVNSHLRENAATPQEIQAAQTAEAKAPSQANIATTHTQMTRPLTQPLTSFKPAAHESFSPGNTAHPSISIQPINHQDQEHHVDHAANPGNAGSVEKLAPTPSPVHNSTSEFNPEKTQHSTTHSQNNPFTGENGASSSVSHNHTSSSTGEQGPAEEHHSSSVVSHDNPTVAPSVSNHATTNEGNNHFSGGNGGGSNGGNHAPTPGASHASGGNHSSGDKGGGDHSKGNDDGKKGQDHH